MLAAALDGNVQGCLTCARGARRCSLTPRLPMDPQTPWGTPLQFLSLPRVLHPPQGPCIISPQALLESSILPRVSTAPILKFP